MGTPEELDELLARLEAQQQAFGDIQAMRAEFLPANGEIDAFVSRLQEDGDAFPSELLSSQLRANEKLSAVLLDVLQSISVLQQGFLLIAARLEELEEQGD